MKKLILLFTIVCAGQLYGMKPELDPTLWSNLPEGVGPLIIMALADSGNDLSTAIDNIKTASRINKALNQAINTGTNLQDFTVLAHLLADEFNVTTKEVAQAFGTTASKEYLTVNAPLEYRRSFSDYDMHMILNTSIATIASIALYWGADVNYTFPGFDEWTGIPKKRGPLLIAIERADLPLIQILLDSGARPEENDFYYFGTFATPEKIVEIKKLLEEARQKQQKK